MMLFMEHVGAYMTPSGAFTFCVHLEPTAAVGSNSHISLVEATLMLNPPSMYSLLLFTANPPGRIVPMASPGQLSGAVRVSMLSATGSYRKTRAVAVTFPAAEPPTQYMNGVPASASTPQAMLFTSLSG